MTHDQQRIDRYTGDMDEMAWNEAMTHMCRARGGTDTGWQRPGSAPDPGHDPGPLGR